jgi:hypothetical protein
MRPVSGGRPGAQRQGKGQGNGQGQGRNQRHDRGRNGEQRTAPRSNDQQNVQQQQLEYHRKQMAEENSRVDAPAEEQGKESRIASLFGWVGRKVA